MGSDSDREMWDLSFRSLLSQNQGNRMEKKIENDMESWLLLVSRDYELRVDFWIGVLGPNA